jgi:hypothetical protein
VIGSVDIESGFEMVLPVIEPDAVINPVAEKPAYILVIAALQNQVVGIFQSDRDIFFRRIRIVGGNLHHSFYREVEIEFLLAIALKPL